MPCVQFLIILILAVFITRLAQRFLMVQSLRKEIDGIISQGQAPIQRIDYLLAILQQRRPLNKNDRIRFEKLRRMRDDLRRGVKHVDSRVIDQTSQPTNEQDS